ncbi:MAG: S53 family peptidase [Chloroflexota bacterium]
MDKTEHRLLTRLGRLIVALALAGIVAPIGSPAASHGPTDPTVRPAAAARESGWSPRGGYSPGQIRHAYGVDRLSGDGAGELIGIVTADDSPAIPGNVQTFIESYHLPRLNGLPGTPACTVRDGPHPCFQRIDSQGPPAYDERWVTETCLNLDWAHVIAPGADLLVVESPRDDAFDMLGAVDLAVRRGARVVAMSWGAQEFSAETLYDDHFQRAGVAFVAATGDLGIVNWPAASPYVISVGGSTLRLDRGGNVMSDRPWIGAVRGYSAYEPEPSYQVNAEIPDPERMRAVPDVAYSANPEAGFPVYNPASSFAEAGWLELGGTSVGVPQWAGLIALADQGRPGHPLTTAQLDTSPIYGAASGPLHWTNFRPVGADRATFDLATGLGAPRANQLVPALARLR